MTEIKVIEVPGTELLTELVELSKHNDGNTLSHQRILGKFIHIAKGGWVPECDEESKEAQYVREFLESDRTGTEVLAVAQEGPKVVGFGGVVINGSCFGSSFTIVHKEHRGRGIGRAIVKVKEDYVREHFPEVKFFIYVTGNGPMAHMSEKMGYVLSGTVMGRRREMKIYIKPARC